MITPHVLREALRSLSQARSRSSEQEPSGLLNPRPQGQGEPGTGRVAVRPFPASGRLWLSVSRHLLVLCFPKSTSRKQRCRKVVGSRESPPPG